MDWFIGKIINYQNQDYRMRFIKSKNSTGLVAIQEKWSDQKKKKLNVIK